LRDVLPIGALEVSLERSAGQAFTGSLPETGIALDDADSVSRDEYGQGAQKASTKSVDVGQFVEVCQEGRDPVNIGYS